VTARLLMAGFLLKLINLLFADTSSGQIGISLLANAAGRYSKKNRLNIRNPLIALAPNPE
ncbi:hypothetical protein, partial [Pantoea dispersa]|uniref:hypothetical protein n=1 Tax=Pantoea dispersa TaxID=59814 RepID=UPI0019D3490C